MLISPSILVLERIAEEVSVIFSSSPSVAKQAVVPSAVISVSGISKTAAGVTGPSLSASVSSASSAPGLAASYALASLRESGQQAGLSERAATFTAESLRLSTRCTYDSRLAGFRKWCTSKACDPRSASLGCVADFFLSLFDKNLSIATIRGYRSAIASVHKGFSNGSTVSNSPFLTRLFRSFFLKRPPARSLVPSWSLPAVLRVLAEAPFEPLQKVSLFFLTVKTVFLLAIASGQRCSSIHALSVEPGHLRWENSGVRLIPSASFLAKNQTESTGQVEIFLPVISSHTAVSEDKVWCPVRALKW